MNDLHDIGDVNDIDFERIAKLVCGQHPDIAERHLHPILDILACFLFRLLDKDGEPYLARLDPGEIAAMLRAIEIANEANGYIKSTPFMQFPSMYRQLKRAPERHRFCEWLA